ncbi:MAG: extradiol ring-cleavage dioxygenase [Rhodospirillales bacterium]|nr:extradiol ring-cleavage dioxygenase [Rhodospirillales bacterium]
MAEIVLGIATSHGPLLSLDAAQWKDRAAVDYRNDRLNLSDGRWITYDALLAEVGGRYASEATLAQFEKREAASQRALDRIAADLAAAKPDVVVIIGDDQDELFSTANMPALAIYYGEEIRTKKWPIAPTTPVYRLEVVKGYAMDRVHVFPGAARFAGFLIRSLVADAIDIAAVATIEDPLKAGIGHAYGFVVNRLFGGRSIPIVPVLINTFHGPNVPTPARCYDFGVALRKAIEASPENLRVAVVASGGLSHFVVDEALDRRVLAAMCSGDRDSLRGLPVEALNSGSSEIRNWIAVAGAIAGMTNRWTEYQPLYRTPAGTGIGVGFGVWDPGAV